MGVEDQRISPGAFVPSPSCCSCSLLISSLTTQLGLSLSSSTSCRSCLPLYTSLPTVIQTHQPTRSPLPPVLHRAANSVYVANDFARVAVDRPPRVVVPRNRASWSLARGSFIPPHIYVHLRAEVGLLSRSRFMAPTIASASLPTNTRERRPMNTSCTRSEIKCV